MTFYESCTHDWIEEDLSWPKSGKNKSVLNITELLDFMLIFAYPKIMKAWRDWLLTINSKLLASCLELVDSVVFSMDKCTTWTSVSKYLERLHLHFCRYVGFGSALKVQISHKFLVCLLCPEMITVHEENRNQPIGTNRNFCSDATEEPFLVTQRTFH